MGRVTAMEKISETVYHLPEVHGGPTILLGDGVVLVDTGVPGARPRSSPPSSSSAVRPVGGW